MTDTTTHPLSDRRWLAMTLLCLGELMIAIDITIVNVALPSIRADLHFTETALAWVVNAYMLTFGGFLLLGGRLGDLYGHRRLFLGGLAVFTLASLACGLSHGQSLLIAARAIQGIGAAVVSATALSLIMDLFPQEDERARAIGIYGFVSAGGGSAGALLGGVLTNSLDWHWNFLINVPLGLAVWLCARRMLPADPRSAGDERPLDIAGAITVTGALLLAIYAIINGNSAGWRSAQTLGLLAAALVTLALFVRIELRVASPLIPLSLFRLHNLAIANVIAVLWAAGMFAWFFLSALYMQMVLGCSPLQVGLAFLPANLLMAAFSLWLSARLVMRFGRRNCIIGGMALVTLGLGLFSLAPVQGDLLHHVLPGMALLGLGSGMALNPVLLAAMDDIAADQSGLASGVVNTAFMMGGALGLAILASVAGARTDSLQAGGLDPLAALTGGYQLAFLTGALMTALTIVLAFMLRPPRET